METSRTIVLRQTSSGPDRAARGKHKPTLEQRFGDEARFIRAWLDNPLVTGAVSPSGRVLSRTMARAINPDIRGPVIELGPGTGPVTEALIRRGIAQDRLILVEFDPDFCKLLARRYPKARVVEGDAYALTRSVASVLEIKAAAVVSSLPLLTKPERQRLSLLSEAFDIMQPDGVFVQFTYGIGSPVPRLDENFQPTGFRSSVSAPVWLNLPPARVWTYRAGADVERYQDDMQRDILVKFRAGTDKLGEEWREKRRRFHQQFLIRTEKAKVEFRTRTDKLKSGLERHNALLKDGCASKATPDLFERGKTDKKPLRW